MTFRVKLWRKTAVPGRHGMTKDRGRISYSLDKRLWIHLQGHVHLRRRGVQRRAHPRQQLHHKFHTHPSASSCYTIQGRRQFPQDAAHRQSRAGWPVQSRAHALPITRCASRIFRNRRMPAPNAARMLCGVSGERLSHDKTAGPRTIPTGKSSYEKVPTHQSDFQAQFGIKVPLSDRITGLQRQTRAGEICTRLPQTIPMGRLTFARTAIILN